MNTNIVRHGEVLLKKIDSLPNEVKLESEESKVIVAHSETGHHHILEVAEKPTITKIKVFGWNGETYIEIKSDAKLWHQKTGKDVHAPHIITHGIYKVIIKKHFDYFKKSLEKVRD